MRGLFMVGWVVVWALERSLVLLDWSREWQAFRGPFARPSIVIVREANDYKQPPGARFA